MEAKILPALFVFDEWDHCERVDSSERPLEAINKLQQKPAVLVHGPADVADQHQPRLPNLAPPAGQLQGRAAQPQAAADRPAQIDAAASPRWAEAAAPARSQLARQPREESLELGPILALNEVCKVLGLQQLQRAVSHLCIVGGHRLLLDLERGSVPGTGPDVRYLVTWFDPVNIHAPGFGFMNELERVGFDVKALKPFGPAVTPHRTIDPAQASAVVHLSIGGEDIRKWRAKPGVEEVAYHDPRSRAERVEYDRLRSEAISELEAAGLPNLVPSVDGNVFGASLDARVPKRARDRLGRMADLGLPAAVFVGPVSAES